MKIEKINENQIRCTLTKEDLASRELKISELAYGTEKAKNLFRDMMRQANFEFGFEAEDIPLMIEAVPLNAGIVLIVTKVEDPEELDTRFSRFAPSVMEDTEDEEWDNETPPSEMLDLFRKIQEARKPSAADAKQTPAEKDAQEDETKRTRVFALNSLQKVMSAAQVTAAHYNGLSALYKDEKGDRYLLVLTQGEASHESFDRICNVISEYGSPQRTTPASLIFLKEHYESLIAENALQNLGCL